MKILYTRNGWEYFDKNGTPLYEGDVVIFPSGAWRILYRTEDGKLGTDATNRKWILSGKAVPCEYGIYPLEVADDVEKCPHLDKFGSTFNELAISLFGKIHFNENGEYTGDTLELKEVVDCLIFGEKRLDDDTLFRTAARVYAENRPDKVSRGI